VLGAVEVAIGAVGVFGGVADEVTAESAIVRIAGKLSNVIFAILKNETEYIPYQTGK
jgi:hypothetical protein